MYPIETRTDDRLHTALDKSLFFVTFVVGSALILGAKGLSAAQWVAPVTGALAIVVFSLISWRTPRFRLREDRIGDGAYYLGFLFTLVSLSYALYQFTELGGVEDVISGFGVALVTTIVGLSLRVLFQQLREDPIEIEQAVRRTLSNEVVSLEREVRLSVESVAALRNRVDEELNKTIGEGLERILLEGRQATLAQIAVFREAIEATLSGVKDAINASSTHAAETRKSTGRLLRAVETLAERIEQTKSPTEGLREKIDDFTRTLDRMLTREAERIEKTRLSADAILSVYQEMENRSLEAAATMEQCKGAVVGLQESISQSAAVAKDMVDKAGAATTDLLSRHERHIELLGRIEEMSGESESALRALRMNVEAEVKAATAALSALERNVVQAAELVVRQLNAQ